MTPLINYLLSATVYLAAFYLFYIILLSNDTQYKRNRIYLMASLIISMILPFLKIDVGSETVLGSLNNNISGLIQIGTVDVNPANNEITLFSFQRLLLVLYISGILISAWFLIYNIFKIAKMIRSGRQKGTRIVFTDSPGVSGFSAFGYIFLSNELNSNEIARITEHESRHIDYNHFSDLILLKLLTLFFWFNPVIYLFERSLKAIHEFQADEKMLDNGENPVSYQQLILNQVFKTRLFSIQNAFSGSTLIKKRMIMMTKKRSRKFSGLKLLLVLPVTILFFVLFSCSTRDTNPAEIISEQEPVIQKTEIILEDTQDIIRDEVFAVVEEMPTFMGGDLNKFREWAQSNVKYPDVAKENGIQGKVYVMFVVNKDGTVTEAKIMRSVDPSLDDEALRVIKSSPKWVAGKQRGEKVRVKYAITINYVLR
ncbi:MAG: TonB family protein [Bacteroidales bacterium]|nr:TonB family protein [Bacteroidales bacterium]